MYDKQGEEHFNLISALHKSIRNSDADASMYWLGRMLQAGEDPLYVARASSAWPSKTLASPRRKPCTCLAARDTARLPRLTRSRPGSRSSCRLPRARAQIERPLHRLRRSPRPTSRATTSGTRPLHLRNAPTELMKELDYGKGYEYAHDVEGPRRRHGLSPRSLSGRSWYRPAQEGREKFLSQRMDEIRRIRASKREQK